MNDRAPKLERKGIAMKLKDRLKSAASQMNEELSQNAAEVETANRHMFLLVLMIGIATFTALWFLSYIVAGFDVFRTPDIILVAAFLALFGLSRLPGIKMPAVVWLYSAFFMYTVLTIWSGIYVTQDYADVMIFVCLFQLPVLTLDRSWRADLIETLFAAVYLLLVIPHKDEGLAKTEIVNVFFFTAAALAAGGFLRRTRVDNFELERQSALREKTDYLTGLHNRRMLFEYLSEKEKKTCTEPIVSMLMLDIDNFKLYNDNYGHVAGDECLRKLGACFLERSANEPVDFFRYGGEEFLGTSCSYGRAEMLEFCESLAAAIREMNISNEAVEKGRVTVSIGVTAADPPQIGKYERMISEADSALYEAKRAGRDRVTGYEPHMTEAEPKSFQ